MSEQHSPEPWAIEKRHDAYTINNRDGQNLIAYENANMEYPEARRIVACVNVCAGIDTDVLEALGRVVMLAVTGRAEMDRLREQRNELVAVLDELLENAHMFPNSIEQTHTCLDFETWAEKAKTALTKARG